MVLSERFRLDALALGGSTATGGVRSSPLAMLSLRNLPSLEITYTARVPNIGLGDGLTAGAPGVRGGGRRNPIAINVGIAVRPPEQAADAATFGLPAVSNRFSQYIRFISASITCIESSAAAMNASS